MRGSLSSPRSWVRLTLITLPPLAVAAAILPVAYAAMFSLFQPYDDEGYLLISLQGHLEGHALYEEVFSQYGPFYYLFNGALFRLLGLEVTHDSGRMLTLGLWILATFVGGVAIGVATRSVLVAISGQLLLVGSLATVVNEPMHPGALLGLLLLTMVLVTVAVFPRYPAAALALLGGLGAAASLVKINVGAFALIAIASAVILTSQFRSFDVLLKIGAALALSVTPFVVMARDLGAEWARSYAALVGLSALAVAVVTARVRTARDGAARLLWFIGGAGGTALLVAAITVATGSGVGALLDGALIQPLRQPEAFSLPFPMSGWAALWGAACLGGGALAAWRSGRPGSTEATMAFAGARVAAGLLIWTSVAVGGRIPGFPLALGLPLVWVAAVPPRHRATSGQSLVRMTLASLAVLQALHAYPVAGSQRAWSALLLVPAGAICLGDGLDVVASTGRAALSRLALRAGAAIPVVAFLVWLLATPLLTYSRSAFRTYDQGVQPKLHGASRLRIDQGQAAAYEELSTILRNGCSTFVSIPGLNSLYLFTDTKPPTYLNATAWMFLFDRSTQERVVQSARDIDGTCTVRAPSILSFWAQGRPVPAGPLVDFTMRDLRRVGRVGDYRVFGDEERGR